MAKYIKHYYVDYGNLVEYFTDKNMGPNGKTHPRLDGLDVKFWFADDNGIDYCLSVVPDSTLIAESSGLSDMTYNAWSSEISGHYTTARASVSANSEMCTKLKKTSAQVLALPFDNSNVDSMLASFAQLNPPMEIPE